MGEPRGSPTRVQPVGPLNPGDNLARTGFGKGPSTHLSTYIGLKVKDKGTVLKPKHIPCSYADPLGVSSQHLELRAEVRFPRVAGIPGG